MSPEQDNKIKIPRARKCLPLNLKMEILRRIDSGERVSKVSKSFGLSESTVRGIMKCSEKIKDLSQYSTPLAATHSTRSRTSIMVTMERLLIAWIEEQKSQNISLNRMQIRSKALKLHSHLSKDLPADTPPDPFLASSGWFHRFKQRAELTDYCNSTNAKDTTKTISINVFFKEEETAEEFETCPMIHSPEVILTYEDPLENSSHFVDIKPTVVPPTELSIDSVTDILKLQENVFTAIKKLDPDTNRSSQFIETVENAISCYRVLLNTQADVSKKKKSRKLAKDFSDNSLNNKS